MALKEIQKKIIQQNLPRLRHRYYYDGEEFVQLSVWECFEDGEIQHIQMNFSNHLIEWKSSGIVHYGYLDEGENIMGIKRTPVILMKTQMKKDVYDLFQTYLQNQSEPIAKFILNLLKSNLTQPELK